MDAIFGSLSFCEDYVLYQLSFCVRISVFIVHVLSKQQVYDE